MQDILSLLQSVQTGSVAHPERTGSSFPGVKRPGRDLNLDNHIDHVPTSRVRRAIPLLLKGSAQAQCTLPSMADSSRASLPAQFATRCQSQRPNDRPHPYNAPMSHSHFILHPPPYFPGCFARQFTLVLLVWLCSLKVPGSGTGCGYCFQNG
jgi:hypothetical protein